MSLSPPSSFLCVAGSCTVVDKKCSHHRCETMRPVLIQKNYKNKRMRKESIKQTNYSISFTDVTFLLMPLQGFFVSESATTGSHEGVCHFGPTFSPLHPPFTCFFGHSLGKPCSSSNQSHKRTGVRKQRNSPVGQIVHRRG